MWSLQDSLHRVSCHLLIALCLLFQFGYILFLFSCLFSWAWISNTMLTRRQWQLTPGLLPGKSHGWRSLAGCSPWSREELDMTEWLHFHFSLSCIGEGNGNPLQCSCLENPRDGRAWWAAVYGIAQSRTRLKQLSSSSSSSSRCLLLYCLYPFDVLWAS